MPFNVNDIYTSSGSVMLQNAWTPYVSKYDTSSFYNWEQDNLPLYDLEERTFENWEQAGYATSAVTGFSLTVSADAATTTEGIAAMLANSNIFSDLPSCIAAIPKVVRFPVLVEVGSFGDLGKLELHNFRIEEGGSIEIINRNFGRVLNASGDSEDVVGEPEYNKSHPLLTTVSSMDLSSTLTETKCVHLNVTVLSATGGMDVRCKNNGNSVFYPKHSLRKAPLTVAFNSAVPMTSNANRFSFAPYENIINPNDSTRGTIDVSATNQATDKVIYRAGLNDSAPERLSVGGNTYFNSCSKISVKNCDGPIYIRNFFVDGETTEPVAIEVNNSEVLLENCAAVRAQEAGFRFNNSKITLSRSAAAYRNYKLTSATTREAQTGYGFHAINSDILVSSLPIPMQTTTVGDEGASGVDCVVMASRNYAGWVLDNSQLRGGVQRRLPSNADTASIIGTELNTGYGMLLNNSHIDVKGLLDVYGDSKGIQTEGSHIIFENLCIDAHSGEAIRSRNSSFLFDSPASPLDAGQSVRKQLDMSANGQHIDLMKNSSFGFRRKNNIPIMYGNTSFKVAHGVIKYNSGNKSPLPALSVNDGSELDLIHASIRVDGTAENIANVPSYGRAIKATNNSKVSCFGSGSGCTFAFGPAGITYQSKMAGFYANNSSEINIHGPAALGQFGVDVLVENNSTLNIEPARARDAFGLEVSAFDLSSGANHTSVELHATRACLVANKNSVINMADLGDFHANWARSSFGQGMVTAGVDYPTVTFDTSAFTSSGSLQFYPNPQDTSSIADKYLADLTNAAGLNFAVPSLPVFATQVGMNRFFATQSIINTPLVPANIEKLTQGGVCLRATEDSVVNVKNVHFPIGTNNSPLDGHYYTTSGTDCDKLMIWNIADTSRLNASFLSVSGMWPGSTDYHGPSGFYASSFNGTHGGNAWDVPASGAPSSTPDTGVLSIYDAFGAGSSIWLPPSGSTINNPFDAFYPLSANQAINSETAELLVDAGINVSGSVAYKLGAGPNASDNQGVFRIYWSPKSAARALQSDLSGYFKGTYGAGGNPAHGGVFSGVLGPAYQTFAQGYNCSGPLSAILLDTGANVSGTYPTLLKLSYDSDGDGGPDQLWTSGFYYCNEFLDDNPMQCLLDESASYTFANSRNASVGLAGRPKRVTVYSSKSDAAVNRTSEAYVGDVSGSLGYKSSTIFDLSRDN